MSEDKRHHLTETLSSLSNEDKAWVINFLVKGLCSSNIKHDEEIANSQRRVARVHHKSDNSPSDEELEELFAGKDVPIMPEEDFTLQEFLNATSGKTIPQIEKWL